MADHRVVIDYKGFKLTGVNFGGRWNVTVMSSQPRLLGLVPQNSTVHAEGKDEAFALARGVAEDALRSRLRPS